MVISMDMESGERSYQEPECDVSPAYDDEVLNANLLPPELALGLSDVASALRSFKPVTLNMNLSLKKLLPAPANWPDASEKQRTAIEKAAQAVLDARANFADSTLADLYDPLSMPPALLKAHQQLDKAVDAAYGRKTFASEAERVAFLFQRYQAITSLLAEDTPSQRRKATP